MPSVVPIFPSSSDIPVEHVPRAFRVDATGVWSQQGDDKNPRWAHVASTPAWVSCVARSAEDADWSAVVKFQTLDGSEHQVVIPYQDLLHRQSGLVQTVSDQGLLVLPSGEQLFREFVARSVALPRIPRRRLIRKLGLNRVPTVTGEDAIVFVTPSQVLVGNEVVLNEEAIFHPYFEHPALTVLQPSGTLAEWQAMVEPLRSNPLLVFALCAGVAAPLLEFAGVDTVLMHFYGQSSAGKTTLLQLIASLYGCGSDPQYSGSRQTLVERWHSTNNALELQTATYSGLVLVIDELGSNTEAALSVYNMTAGRGKNRMSDVGKLRKTKNWSLFVASTGEVSMADKIEGATGQRAKTGEVIRAMDIPIAGVSNFPELSDDQISKLMQNVKDECAKKYGTAGPAAMQQLLDDFPTADQLLPVLTKNLDDAHELLCARARDAGYRLLPPHIRALRRMAFVLLGGQAGMEVIGLTDDQVEEAVWSVTEAWLSSLPPLSEEDRVVGLLTDYIVRYMAQMVNYDTYNEQMTLPSPMRAILHKGWLLFTEGGLAEACAGTPPKVAARLLKKCGILHTEGGKLTSRHVLGRLGLPRAAYYAVTLSRLRPDIGLSLTENGEVSEGESPETDAEE